RGVRADVPRGRRRTIRRRGTAGGGERTGHLRRQRAARGRGGAARPDRPDRDHRRRLRREDLRRAGLPPRALRAPEAAWIIASTPPCGWHASNRQAYRSWSATEKSPDAGAGG